MLSLDDPRWNDLHDAYGPATRIPDLLRALAASPGPTSSYEDEPWFSLWSSLCHQGDAYTASYAAVPHLVKIACEAQGPIDFSFLQLPAAIEIARATGRGPTLPDADADAYRRAIAGLMNCVNLHHDDPWDRAMLLSASAAQAVAKGHIDVAEALIDLDAYWIARIINSDLD